MHSKRDEFVEGSTGEDNPVAAGVHATAWRLLRRVLANANIAHAYIFFGEEGMGKLVTARHFAAALNCLAGGPEPCCSCSSCEKMAGSNHPDFHSIEPQGATIRIDQVRELGRRVYLRPFEGKWKVFALKAAERMTQEAANSFLKILEEPPPRTVFLLLTANIGMLLPTIRSRCQTIRFQPLPLDEVRTVLERDSGVSPSQSRVFAVLSRGNPGVARELAISPEFRRLREKALALTQRLLTFREKEIFQIAEQLDDTGADLNRMLEIMATMMRDGLICGTGFSGTVPLINEDLRSDMEALALASPLGTSALARGIREIERMGQAMAENANRRLALEVLVARLQANQTGSYNW